MQKVCHQKQSTGKVLDLPDALYYNSFVNGITKVLNKAQNITRKIKYKIYAASPRRLVSCTQRGKLKGLIVFLGGAMLESLFYRRGNMNSLLYRLDPRVKVVSLVGFVAFTSSLEAWPALLAGLVFLLLLAGVSRISAFYLMKRLAWILPFGGVLVIILPFAVPGETFFKIFPLAASVEGVRQAIVLIMRLLNAAAALSLLTATTGFKELMTAFRALRAPQIFVLLIEFTVRYISVLTDEARRMQTARKARGFEKGRSLLHRCTFQVTGQLIGILFIRSFERSERVYNAMLARGYAGGIRVNGGPRPGRKDICWGTVILAFAAGLWLIEFGGVQWPILLK
ncbi:MAG: cobalt ECF transporter T component CbiQ [Peptococcaceae bacterium]|nr:MAG: cobalt ECF transporter T component CbiQ [Peptococcaceae bacterium]